MLAPGIEDHTVQVNPTRGREGDGNLSRIRDVEGGDISRLIRHRRRVPIGRRIPVAAGRVQAPGRAAGKDSGQRTERKHWNHGTGQNGRFHDGIVGSSSFRTQVDS